MRPPMRHVVAVVLQTAAVCAWPGPVRFCAHNTWHRACCVERGDALRPVPATLPHAFIVGSGWYGVRWCPRLRIIEPDVANNDVDDNVHHDDANHTDDRRNYDPR